MLDTKLIKKDFPIFKTHPNLVYLDSTATSLKPVAVIDKITSYYRDYSANVHRGIYRLSEQASAEYEGARQIVADFIGAKTGSEVIFTRGTTEAINLLTYSLPEDLIVPGDEIVTTIMEHHSNFVPWQQMAKRKKAKFKIIDITDEGYLSVIPNSIRDLDPGPRQTWQASKAELDPARMTSKMLDPASRQGGQVQHDKSNEIDLRPTISKRTKILAITYISNVLGTVNPIKAIIAAARRINPKIIVVVDAAQATPHHKIDVTDLDCDFLAFSGHKMLGPTGIGVLWGKKGLLEAMRPFNYGGDMVEEVYVDHSTFQPLPAKFEAGTQHIAGAIGLGEAIKYLQQVGMPNIERHEHQLLNLFLSGIGSEFREEIRVLGPSNSKDKVGIAAFTFRNIHPHDIAQILDEDSIAIRVGFHCAMPLHTRLGVAASSRASFYLYNDGEDVEKLIKGLKKSRKILRN